MGFAALGAQGPWGRVKRVGLPEEVELASSLLWCFGATADSTVALRVVWYPTAPFRGFGVATVAFRIRQGWLRWRVDPVCLALRVASTCPGCFLRSFAVGAFALQDG